MNLSSAADIYSHMQAAVDIVNTSTHPTNKIAATIVGTDNEGKAYALSRVNHWPKPIDATIGRGVKIGNSSGTIHAETEAILDAPKTDGACVFVTDPPCPNCVKNMAEAGIQALYIDHKGFDKDWVKRRGESFDQMSMKIAYKAGMNVYVLYRQEQRLEEISKHREGYTPKIESLASIETASEDFRTLIAKAGRLVGDEAFALGLAKDPNGNLNGGTVSICVHCHPSGGYTNENVQQQDDKYSFILQPINRLLMIASKEGLTLDPAQIYSSRVPTSRELINFIGAGLRHIHIGDRKTARDEYGPRALQQLMDAGILNVDD